MPHGACTSVWYITQRCDWNWNNLSLLQGRLPRILQCLRWREVAKSADNGGCTFIYSFNKYWAPSGQGQVTKIFLCRQPTSSRILEERFSFDTSSLSLMAGITECLLFSNTAAPSCLRAGNDTARPYWPPTPRSHSCNSAFTSTWYICFPAQTTNSAAVSLYFQCSSHVFTPLTWIWSSDAFAKEKLAFDSYLRICLWVLNNGMILLVSF